MCSMWFSHLHAFFIKKFLPFVELILSTRLIVGNLKEKAMKKASLFIILALAAATLEF